MAKKIKIKQVRSVIGRLINQKRTMRALGISKMQQTVVHDDNPAIRGMIRTIQHLVSVEEVDGE